MDRLINVGKLRPKNSLEISKSRIGLGFEKLDRDAFDPEKAYDRVYHTGVKWVRIQSGWQKTEREKGVYDFIWLDNVIDNLIKRGLKPWICLCYGNQLYNEEAKTVYGAVGCFPIYTEHQKKGWSNYVKAVVKRYKGRVSHYEIWNEPDAEWQFDTGISGENLGKFNIDTAKAIREIDTECEIIGGVISKWDIAFLTDAMEAGMGDWINAISYHAYTYDEKNLPHRVESLRGVIDQYNPEIKIIQGELGSQSNGNGAGALQGCAGTPRKQAKQLLRHIMIDLMTEVEFTSHFSCMDMKEALNGTVGDKASYKDFGYFGILGAEFDDEGNAIGEYTPKDSYYALQNICSLFSDNCTPCNAPVLSLYLNSPRLENGMDTPVTEMTHGAFKLNDGRIAYVYWKPVDILTTEFEGTVTFRVNTDKETINIIDLYDGQIYEIPECMIENSGIKTKQLNHIPIKDYPLVLIL